MAFSGIDDMVAELAAGKRQRLTGNRIIQTGATSVAGRWHECFTSTGMGGVGVLTGTAGLGAARDSTSPGALPISPQSVTPDTRHLLTLSCVTPIATVCPGTFKLIDILYVYPSCVISTGAGTTINNGAAKPTRHNNGAGVRLGAVVVGALGAATPVITATYVDQDGNTGNTGLLAASANSLPVGVMLSGAGVAVLAGPDMSMAAGDSGVRELTSYTTATGTTGTIAFFLYRDLGDVPLVAANVAGERDFLSQMPSLDRIDDLACLTGLVNIGGAMTANANISVTVGAGWG